MRRGITVLHVDSIMKEKGNGKRKRSLGCARDDETGEGYFPFLFIPLRKPTSTPSGHLLPEEGGRYENAVFPASSFRAEARNLFRSRSIRKRGEDSGSREAPYTKRRGITALHADSITKEKGNEKRKRSLGWARDDETREGISHILFRPLA